RQRRGDRGAPGAAPVLQRPDYDESFMARVRDVIGAHYKHADIVRLVKTEFTDEAVLATTAAEVGGLGRIGDPFVRAMMNDLNGGGDFMTDPNRSLKVAQALDVAGNLTVFVDHLFDAL